MPKLELIPDPVKKNLRRVHAAADEAFLEHTEARAGHSVTFVKDGLPVRNFREGWPSGSVAVLAEDY